MCIRDRDNPVKRILKNGVEEEGCGFTELMLPLRMQDEWVIEF